MKIFMIYIGGATETSLIELHDIRFVVAKTLKDTEEALKASWWGTPGSLHMDCWGALESADGHNLHLKPEPYTGEDKLFFVNLGGYDPGEFTELHKNVLVTAPTASKAKVKALKTILDWKSHHKDYLFEVENIFCVNEAAAAKGLYLHLEKTDNPVPFTFNYGYKPLAKNPDR
jgi:hypothetical protein